MNETVLANQMRVVLRAVLALVVLALVFVAGDWLVWQVRLHQGHGFDSLSVTRMVVASLKGNREEYYPDGTADERCSRSVLPWGGSRPCWYVARHRVQVLR